MSRLRNLPGHQSTGINKQCLDKPRLLLLLLSCFSRVRLYATPQTAAHQAPLPLGFSRQEHWSGLPFPSPNPYPICLQIHLIALPFRRNVQTLAWRFQSPFETELTLCLVNLPSLTSNLLVKNPLLLTSPIPYSTFSSQLLPVTILKTLRIKTISFAIPISPWAKYFLELPQAPSIVQYSPQRVLIEHMVYKSLDCCSSSPMSDFSSRNTILVISPQQW